MKTILSIFIFITMILTGNAPDISAAEPDFASKIPTELIARKLKKHDSSLAISAEAVRYKIRHNQPFTLVDVRRNPDFERLHIPGSINIPLYAVKAKTYLKTAPLVLINDGFRYAKLEAECRRLTAQGFQVSIMDGGLPAWNHRGGQLVGDLFALDDMKTVLPQVFFQEKDYENTLVVDISSQPGEASGRLIPYAKHIPVLDNSDKSIAQLRKLFKKNKSFQSVVIFNEIGEHYEKADKIMTRAGIETYHLQGGVAEYQRYLNGLLLSRKPHDSRMKTVGTCKPCGEKIEKE